MSTQVWQPLASLPPLPPAPILIRSNASLSSPTILPPYLEKVSSGYKHTHKNIHIRSTSGTNIEPILKAAKNWLKVKDLEQDKIAQSDEIWNFYEEQMKAAKTDLEIYSIFQKIPKPAIKYKDLCNNNLAHRLILALKNHTSETVDGVWYLLDSVISPYMNDVNDFGHTPWELMGSVPTAFEKVLQTLGAELLHIVPIRSWRKHQVYVRAWELATNEQRISFSRTFKKHNLDMLCYLTQNNPQEIAELTRNNKHLLEGCTIDIKNNYPLHAEHLLVNLI